MQVSKVRPLFDSLSVAVGEFPAQCMGETEPAVVGGAAANANDTAGGARACRAYQGASQAVGVATEGGILVWREHGEADDVGGFDDGCAGVEPPWGGDFPVDSIDGGDLARVSAQLAAQ